MMTCPKCGSENVEVQLVQESKGSTIKTKSRTKTSTQRGHGCLWWVFVGWWWWMIDLMFWMVAFIPRLIIQLHTGRKDHSRSTTKTVTNQKNHTVYRSMCLCHNCGHHWEE